MSALKRVKALMVEFPKACGINTDVADLRALVALAESAGELKRRIRVATLSIRRISTGTIDGGASVLAALRALDLKRPLPTASGAWDALMNEPRRPLRRGRR